MISLSTFFSQYQPPIALRWVIRMQMGLIVVLALLAGYFQTLYSTEAIKYLRLEDKYVRVRQQLGVEETERLIQASYQDTQR